MRNLCVALLCFGAPMALLVATLVRVNGGGGGEWEGLGVDDFVLDPPEHVRRPRVAWAADSGSLMAVERVGGAASPSLFAVDAESGARALLLAPADVVNATDGAPVDYDDVVARSPDGGAALLRNGVQSHWRHSTVAHYFVVQLRDDAPNAPAAPTAAISVASGVQHAVWRPRQPASRRSLAYVAGNDVHIAVVAGSEVEVQRVTTDGSDTRVNGVPDWLDEEEVFESEVAMWWSDDGSRLAFASFDLADVPVFSIPRYEGGAYTAQMDVRYPSPGYPNPVASLWVVAEGRSPVEVDLGADGFGAGRYVHAVQWAAQGDAQRLLVRTLNRAQTRDCLLEVSARACLAPAARARAAAAAAADTCVRRRAALGALHGQGGADVARGAARAALALGGGRVDRAVAQGAPRHARRRAVPHRRGDQRRGARAPGAAVGRARAAVDAAALAHRGPVGCVRAWLVGVVLCDVLTPPDDRSVLCRRARAAGRGQRARRGLRAQHGARRGVARRRRPRAAGHRGRPHRHQPGTTLSRCYAGTVADPMARVARAGVVGARSVASGMASRVGVA